MTELPNQSTEVSNEPESTAIPKKGIQYGKRKIKLTKEKMDKFLECLRELPNVSLAARQCGFTGAGAFYIKRKEDPEFAEAWGEALQTGVELLEAEAMKRAQNKSDLLMMFLLKGNMPEKYKERQDITSGGEKIEMSPITMVEVHLQGNQQPQPQLGKSSVEINGIDINLTEEGEEKPAEE